jgi:hypothetical protein
VLLKERPEMAFAGLINRPTVKNKYGTDPSLKPQGLAILKQTLTPDFISRLMLLRLVEALSKFQYDPTGKRYNCDITMATMEAEIMAKDEEFIPVFSSYERKQLNGNKKGIKTYKKKNGVIVEVIV